GQERRSGGASLFARERHATAATSRRRPERDGGSPVCWGSLDHLVGAGENCRRAGATRLWTHRLMAAGSTWFIALLPESPSSGLPYEPSVTATTKSSLGTMYNRCPPPPLPTIQPMSRRWIDERPIHH